MFLNITEDDIRADCPHIAPLTLRAFNKISPRQFNRTLSPLNPYEIPRYAPTSVAQFSKTLLEQQVTQRGEITTSLQLASIESAILAETVVDDFLDNIGFDADVAITLGDLEGTEEEKAELDEEEILAIISREEAEEPLTRRTKQQMTESRAMGAEDTRTTQLDQDRLRARVAKGAAKEGAKERKPPEGLTPKPPGLMLRGSSDPPPPGGYS